MSEVPASGQNTTVVGPRAGGGQVVRVRGRTQINGVRSKARLAAEVDLPAGTPQVQLTAITLDKVAGMNLSANRCVRPDDDGLLVYADHQSAEDMYRPVWLTLQSAVLGGPCKVLAYGERSESTWTWDPDRAIYLAATGQLTQTYPDSPASLFQLRVAQVVKPDTIFFEPSIPYGLA